MGHGKKYYEDGSKKEFNSIKCGLPSLIRPEYRAQLISFISYMSVEATWIALLASLLFLFKVFFLNYQSNALCLIKLFSLFYR